MDSLTQIVLGAAVGEAVAGRKMGNRAMFWGAVGGTIPDLDVISSLFLPDMESLAFHRGITHSIAFGLVAPVFFAYLSSLYYRKRWHKNKGVNIAWNLIQSVVILLVVFLLVFIAYNIHFSAIVIVAVPLLWLLYLFGRRIWWSDGNDFQPISFGRWYLLYMLAFLTHILLDTCTPYGTQVFQPFSDYRAGFNNISVVDPVYTVPFLVFLLLASFARRISRRRKLWNGIALAVSTTYLLATVGIKVHVDGQFKDRLEREGVSYEKTMTSPTIFNTVLWHGSALTKDGVYEGYYSLLDEVPPFDELKYFPLNEHLAAGCEGSDDLEIVRWFSKEFVIFREQEPGEIYAQDMRFGSIWPEDPDKEPSFIFSFRIHEDCSVSQQREEPSDGDDFFGTLWRRIRGI